MIISVFSTFRLAFCLKAQTSASLTFVAGAPATITRAVGSFVTDGYTTGMKVDVFGTISSNGRYTIASVAALTLTLATGQTLVNEGPVSCTLLGRDIDVDGYERWPIEKMRIGGFVNTLQGVPKPFTDFPWTITCNASAADAVPGVDDYDWYLSQRTDDQTRQYLVMTPVTDKSGSFTLNATALFAQVYSEGATSAAIRALFERSHMYVQRRSDKSIQFFDLLRFVGV